MDAITFIRQALTQAQQRFMATLDGLTDADAAWRPAPNTNTILEIAWHVARIDDRLGRRATGLGPELWESQGWSERLGTTKEIRARGAVPVPEEGGRGTAASRRHQGLPSRATCATRSRSCAASHARRPRPGAGSSAQPDRNVATQLRHMITHKNNHHGQIDFMRGLRHPEWELTPGTGVVEH